MRKKPVEPEHPEPETLEHFTGQVKGFLLRNWLHLLLAIGLVAMAGLGLRIVSLRRSTRVVTQWEAVTNYPELTSILYGPENVGALREIAVKQCQAVIESGHKTPATPWVMLKLGHLYAFGDEWAAAEQAYRRLIADYPESPAAAWAKPALAVSLEQLGKYADAAAAYEGLGEGGAGSFLYDAGRCRELAGDLTGAEADYRKLLDSGVTGDMGKDANARLTALAQGMPLTAPPELKVAAVTPPGTPQVLTAPPETGVAPMASAAPMAPAAPMPSALPTPQVPAEQPSSPPAKAE